MSPRRRSRGLGSPSTRMVVVCVAVITGTLGGCGSGGGSWPGGADDVVAKGEPPPFAEAARRYNSNIGGLSRLRAGAVIRMSFVEDGKRRDEQGEGLLQAIAPDRFALSMKKVGQSLFWVGCDGHRSWWFDLSSTPVTATIGGHDAFLDDARRRIGLAVGPRELAVLIGMSGIDVGEDVVGGTQWSADGALLGITTSSAEGVRRVWVDPRSYRARKVEWFDAGGAAALVADLEGEERVDVSDTRGGRPIIPARIGVHHLESGTHIRLDLSSAEDRRVRDEAFEFDELVRYHRAEKVIDLDGVR